MIGAVLLILLVSFLSIYVYGDREIELNPVAKHVQDVNSILHAAVHRKVIIDMNSHRECKEPHFTIRLSGTSLYILNYVKDDSGNTFHFSYPPLPDAGIYFLEVVLLACEKIKPNNFALQCLEDPQEGKNVLTLPYSFTLSADQVYGDHRPRWVLEPNLQPDILHTRYQRLGCVPQCGPNITEMIPFDSYEWVGQSNYSQLLSKALASDHNSTSPNGQEVITFCMIGASHARFLTEQGNKLEIPRVKFIHIDSRFPFQFDAEHYLPGCSYAILGYGQWPLGWMMVKLNNSYTAHMYETEMREVFRRVQVAQSPTTPTTPVTTQIFTRSMNYNGLAGPITSCPPTDHRNPQVIDVYNSILKNLSAEFGVSFINTTAVQGPLWDGGLDYHHPTPKVLVAEIEHIVHHALEYSLKHHRAPVLVARDAQRGQRNTLVRFDDSTTVYLYAGGVMRALLNERLFLTLGYAKLVDRVLVWDASERKKYTFGPDLHYVKAFYFQNA